MKQIFTVLVTMASLTFTSAAWADCQVYIPLCPNNHALSNQVFKDHDPTAMNHPNRCMERAREYFNYCGIRADSGVTTFFYTASGTPVLAQSVTRTESMTYGIDGSGKVWIPLKAAY